MCMVKQSSGLRGAAKRAGDLLAAFKPCSLLDICSSDQKAFALAVGDNGALKCNHRLLCLQRVLNLLTDHYRRASLHAWLSAAVDASPAGLIRAKGV